RASPCVEDIEAAARSFGLQPQLLDVRKPEALGRVFESAIRQRADALVVGLDTLLRRELSGPLSPRRDLRGQDLQGHAAGGFARRAPDEVRAGDQPQDR